MLAIGTCSPGSRPNAIRAHRLLPYIVLPSERLPREMNRTLALLVIAVAPMTVVACSGGDDDDDAAMDTSSDMSSATTGAAASAEFNDADVTFAQGMIPHHEQAVEMSDIALDPAREASPEVVDLATRVKEAQDPEIELMTGWLEEWDQPTEMEMTDGDMASMGGMMSDEQMDALAAASGTEFDQLWQEMMIAHHEGAIEMAETEQDAGRNAEAIDLAGQIISAQQAEIDEMNTMLAS